MLPEPSLFCDSEQHKQDITDSRKQRQAECREADDDSRRCAESIFAKGQGGTADDRDYCRSQACQTCMYPIVIFE